MAAVLALLASLLWGVVDFLGGTTSRRLPTFAVIGGDTFMALVRLLPIVALTGHLDDDLSYLPWAIAAGLVGLVAVAAFYAALAAGTMGVVAPIAAVGVILPVLVGLAQGEEPSLLQLLGAVITISGVFLASGPEIRGSGQGGARPILLAFVAAVGFGGVLILIAEGSDESVPMTLVAMRVATLSVLLTAALVLRTLGGLRLRDAPVLTAIGWGDVGANAAFAVATTSGLVSLTAVLASLYPAVTVLLARLVHKEQLRRIQDLGAVLTLGGVVLIAAGGGAG